MINNKEEFIDMLKVMQQEAYVKERQKQYSIYLSEGIEALCEDIAQISKRRFISREEIKNFILRDKDSPLSEEDNVYLAAYNVG